VKQAQDKGARALARAFIEATRGAHAAPIPLAELIAVSEATLAIEAAIRYGTVETCSMSRDTHPKDHNRNR
jgi:pyrimidine deaminase RibD-like protein